MLTSFYPILPDFSGKRFLVTGGAGFIGSHLLDFLVATGAARIKVLDNLITGSIANIQHLLKAGEIEFFEGDITRPEVCGELSDGVDVVIHLAALGSVPRSIANPLASHEANSTGFLNILWAAKEKGVEKVIYASSSSVYGDNLDLPKKEGKEGSPLSPYAFTKQSNEAYAKLFFELYGLQTIGMRFFNIFGPRQSKFGPYAAFIPLAMDALMEGKVLTLNGDGRQCRDFTFVPNAVWALGKAISASLDASGKAYNIACGGSTSLLEIVSILEDIAGKSINVQLGPPRQGDIKDSLADILMAKTNLDFQPVCDVKEGLAETLLTFNS